MGGGDSSPLSRAACEFFAISRGLGGRAKAVANQRLQLQAVDEAAAGLRLCWLIGRFGFALELRTALTPLRVPLISNLRRDPYECAYLTSNTYYDWMIDRSYLLVPAQAYVADFLETFREFPPRQKPASFSIDQVLERMNSPGGSS